MAVPEALAAPRVSPLLLWQVVTVQQANRRQGTASSKRRGEVSGGGRKPWRQKGTGRARHGSIRSPIWVGGGVAHGPRPHSYRGRITQKMRQRAFALALASKLAQERVRVVDPLSAEQYKTGAVRALLQKLGLGNGERTLMLLREPDAKLYRSAHNLPGVRVRLLPTVEIAEVLWADSILLSRGAAQALFEEGQRWQTKAAC